MTWSYEPKNTWFFGKTLAKLGQECLKHQFEGQGTFLVHQSIFQQWRNLPNNAFGQVWPRKCREDAKFPISKIFLPAWGVSWIFFPWKRISYNGRKRCAAQGKALMKANITNLRSRIDNCKNKRQFRPQKSWWGERNVHER